MNKLVILILGVIFTVLSPLILFLGILCMWFIIIIEIFGESV